MSSHVLVIFVQTRDDLGLFMGWPPTKTWHSYTSQSCMYWTKEFWRRSLLTIILIERRLFISIAKNPHVHCPGGQLWQRVRQKKGRHKKPEKKPLWGLSNCQLNVPPPPLLFLYFSIFVGVQKWQIWYSRSWERFKSHPHGVPHYIHKCTVAQVHSTPQILKKYEEKIANIYHSRHSWLL